MASRTGRRSSTFAVAVDVVLLTVREGALHVLCVERGIEPYAGEPALPGGFVLPEEDLVDAARRELAEETGLDVVLGHLEQLATYGAPQRDPRQRVVSVAYLALVPDLPVPVAGSDAASSRWEPVGPLLDRPDRLAFDHGTILRDGVERARAKLEYTTLATAFCGETFTVAELRAVYEAVWGTTLDARNFHRKVTGTPGFVVDAGTSTTRGGGRPARLYVAGAASALVPPVMRA